MTLGGLRSHACWEDLSPFLIVHRQKMQGLVATLINDSSNNDDNDNINNDHKGGEGEVEQYITIVK